MEQIEWWKLKVSSLLSVISGAIVVFLGIWLITSDDPIFRMMWYWRREIIGVGVLALVSGALAIISGTFIIMRL